jgi:hypothetical protein
MDAVGCAGDGPVVMMLRLLLVHHRGGLGVGRWQLDTWWGVAGAVVDILSTWLSNAGLGELAVILIDCCLHLFKDLIDRGQITARFDIAHGWQTVALHGVIAIVAPSTTRCGRHWLVGWDGGQRGLGDQRQLQTLKFIQALADVLIGQWIEATSLDLSKEVVESLKAALASLKVVQGSLLRGCGCIVDVAIGWVRGLVGMRWLVILVRTRMMATVVSAIAVDRVVVRGRTWARSISICNKPSSTEKVGLPLRLR